MATAQDTNTAVDRAAHQFQQDWAEACQRAAQVFVEVAPTEDDWAAFWQMIARLGFDINGGEDSEDV